MADFVGRKRVVLAGLVGFAGTSLLIGVSPWGGLVIGLRALQGLSAAFMSAAALATLIASFPDDRERERALSVWGFVAFGGAAVGVVLSGVVTQYLGWRWIFFINVPVGVLAGLGVWQVIPANAPQRGARPDAPGASHGSVFVEALEPAACVRGEEVRERRVVRLAASLTCGVEGFGR